MNDTLSKVLIFTAGAAIGSAVTWKILKTKYDQIVQEEIESIKDAFSDKTEEFVTLEEVRDEIEQVEQIAPKEPTNIKEYASKIKEQGYVNYAGVCVDEGVTVMPEPLLPRPRIIPPDELGDIDGYDVITLNYFADKVLTDELNVLVDDVDNVIGVESLTHFGEFEDDSVCVRNDRLKADYEILLDSRNYADLAEEE